MKIKLAVTTLVCCDDSECSEAHLHVSLTKINQFDLGELPGIFNKNYIFKFRKYPLICEELLTKWEKEGKLKNW